MDIRRLGHECGTHLNPGDRLREIVRRRCSQRLINVGQMLSIELVKIAIVGRVVFGAIPPVPVAALGDQNLVKSQLALCFGGTRGVLRVELTSMMQVVPGAIVFRRPYPDVEVGVDP